MERVEELGIRIKRRDGRNVFVFHRRGSDLYELEEVPPFEVEDERTRVAWATPDADSDADRPAGGTWSRTSLSKLSRALGESKRRG